MPNLIDEDGCVMLGPGPDERNCSRVQTRVLEPLPTDPALLNPEGSKSLVGFGGPRYLEVLERDGIFVLQDTVTVVTEGAWSAMGLVRNETDNPAGQVTVMAELSDTSGGQLATVTTEAPVAPLRPGEPAPFEVSADVPVEEVASVAWSTTHLPEVDLPSRETEIFISWTRPYGAAPDQRVVMRGLFGDAETGPLPFLRHVSVMQVPPRDIGAPLPVSLLVSAWIDETGSSLCSSGDKM